MTEQMMKEILEDWMSWKYDIWEANTSTWTVRDDSKVHMIGVILQETLDDDMDKMFNIKVKSRQNNNSENKQTVTNEMRSIIKSHLKKDYLMIEKMFKKGWITKNQYDILSV